MRAPWNRIGISVLLVCITVIVFRKQSPNKTTVARKEEGLKTKSKNKTITTKPVVKKDPPPPATEPFVQPERPKIENTDTGGGFEENFAYAKNHPFKFQLIFATVKTSLADLLTQTVAQRKPLSEVDWKRNIVFIIFGFAYLGCFQWYLLVTKYRQWFPSMDRFAQSSFDEKMHDSEGIRDAFEMAAFDLLIHTPFIYFPSYYLVKEFVSSSTWNPVEWVKGGCQKYVKNWGEDMTAVAYCWLPADCVQFTLPLEARLPFRHTISFFWTVWVSFVRGSIQETEEAKGRNITYRKLSTSEDGNVSVEEIQMV